MNLKLQIGKLIDSSINSLINKDHNSLKFIPIGRYLTLDLKRANAQIEVVFDVGANIGQTSLNLIKSFPQSYIHSFEPIKKTYASLVQNTKPYTHITNNQFALGDQSHTLNIATHSDSELNSLVNIVGESALESEEINIWTGINYCRDKNITHIDLLKIDTEGYELKVLEGFTADFLRENVNYIYAEVGFDKTDPLKTHYSDLEEYLSKKGFITTGFYEPYRWGKNKFRLGFCNVLFTNTRKL